MPELGYGLTFRPANDHDHPGFETFQCSTGAPYQNEVESFIRERALRLATLSTSQYRLCVVFEGERLVAVFAHHPELLLVETGTDTAGALSFNGTNATRLHVLAISVPDQGRRFPDGRRLSDLVMETLVADATFERPVAILTAVAAKDNLASIRLCERHGLKSQVEYDADYVRMSGRFVKAS